MTETVAQLVEVRLGELRATWFCKSGCANSLCQRLQDYECSSLLPFYLPYLCCTPFWPYGISEPLRQQKQETVVTQSANLIHFASLTMDVIYGSTQTETA